MSKFFNLRALMSAITGILIAPMATFGLLAESHIVVSKVSMEIAVVENSETVFRSRCAVGRNFGDKQADGDCKTPAGTFTVHAFLKPSAREVARGASAFVTPTFLSLKSIYAKE